MVKKNFKGREKDTNKGSFGTLALFCGSPQMTGAAVLASRAAMRSGVGMVNLFIPKSIHSILTSLMIEPVFTIFHENEHGVVSKSCANEILKKQKTVLYQTAPIMLDSIIDYRFGKNSTNIYNNILDVDLLIIDDLGTECINNMKFTELFNIINTRLLNQNNKSTKTIISTNLSIQNLFNSYDERIVSRLIGNYNICRFYGEDLRFKLRK